MISTTNRAALTLVGAGPGDEELITLKAIKALAAADVVFYDALANEALLQYARPEAPRIQVGKRAGLPPYQQRQINQMIVWYAQRYGHVVWLKGGDPGVFGLGHEEKAHAEQHGIPVAVVPGISSAAAVPAACHIPLTHRGLNESFWVLTAPPRQAQLPADLRLAARSSATIVILRGMKWLEQITTLFAAHRGAHEPVAVLQRGTSPEAKVCVGTLDTIVRQAVTRGLRAPAVVVIGAVVAKHGQCVQQMVSPRIQGG